MFIIILKITFLTRGIPIPSSDSDTLHFETNLGNNTNLVGLIYIHPKKNLNQKIDFYFFDSSDRRIFFKISGVEHSEQKWPKYGAYVGPSEINSCSKFNLRCREKNPGIVRIYTRRFWKIWKWFQPNYKQNWCWSPTMNPNPHKKRKKKFTKNNESLTQFCLDEKLVKNHMT